MQKEARAISIVIDNSKLEGNKLCLVPGMTSCRISPHCKNESKDELKKKSFLNIASLTNVQL